MQKKKKEFFLARWFKRCFLGNREELTLQQEEQIQTPAKTMLKNFIHKRLAMVGLIGFLVIFVFVLIGPHIWVLDLSDQDSTLTNIPPTSNMMDMPQELIDAGIQDIASGNTYGMGIDESGKLYIWGYTKITDKIDIKDVPD